MLTQLPWIVLAVQSVILVAAIVVVVRLYATVNSLSRSFAKMGYVVREDMKKAFAEASNQAAEAQVQVEASNAKIVEEAMQKSLVQASELLKQTIAKAEADAGMIRFKAQQDAQQITADTQKKSRHYLDKLAAQAAQSVEWALQQYLRDDVPLKVQEDMIEQLVRVYLNEHKRL